MYRPLLVLIAALAPLAAGDPPRAIIAELRADWCASCSGHAPVVEAVRARLPAAAVHTITIDVTTPAARAEGRRVAQRLGIARFYDQHLLTPGTYAVIAHLQPKPVIAITADADPAETAERIRQGLAEPAPVADWPRNE